MSSTFWNVLAIWTGILGTGITGGLVGLFSTLGHYAKQREADEAKLAEQSRDEINRDKTTERIASILRSLGLNVDELWNKYPNGYVLFAGRGQSRQVVPLFNRSASYPVADWESTELDLVPTSKRFLLKLSSLNWKKPDGSPEHVVIIGGTHVYDGIYEIGKPLILNAIKVAEGQLYPTLDVLDDSNQKLCFVIGFKASGEHYFFPPKP